MWACICTLNPNPVSRRGEPASSIDLPSPHRGTSGYAARLSVTDGMPNPHLLLGCLCTNWVQVRTDHPRGPESHLSCLLFLRGISCFLMLLISWLPQDFPLRPLLFLQPSNTCVAIP